jgi:hypothetical protein
VGAAHTNATAGCLYHIIHVHWVYFTSFIYKRCAAYICNLGVMHFSSAGSCWGGTGVWAGTHGDKQQQMGVT